MPINVLDVGTSQRNIDFALASRQGWAAVYVKLGGDNSGRYVAPYYITLVDRARAAGMRVGHYWVPSNTQNPTLAADYFVNNLRGWTPRDFVVLDNENLDGHVRYSDAQAREWQARVCARLNIPVAQVKVYSGLADARTTTWPALNSAGTEFIIAAYSYQAMQLPAIPTIPAGKVIGHQYSSSGAVANGIITDRNLFTDNAFNYTGTASNESDLILPTNGESTMLMIHKPNPDPKPGMVNVYAIFEAGFWLEFTGDAAANTFIRQMSATGTSWPATEDFWNTCKAKAYASLTVGAVPDVDALAAAVAARLTVPTAAENGAAARDAIVK